MTSKAEVQQIHKDVFTKKNQNHHVENTLHGLVSWINYLHKAFILQQWDNLIHFILTLIQLVLIFRENLR